MDNKPLDRLLQYTDLSGKQKYKDPNFNQQHGTTNISGKQKETHQTSRKPYDETNSSNFYQNKG